MRWRRWLDDPAVLLTVWFAINLIAAAIALAIVLLK
jgi:hypothetical protein